MNAEAQPASRLPSGSVHRLGRAGSVWAWRDWAYAGEDGTFGNRFDDAAGTFRVHYASSQRLGAFLETLARFRPDPHVIAATIAESEEDASYPSTAAGLVSERWIADRAISEATLDGDFVDIGHSATLAYLRVVMASRLLHFDLDDVDAAAIRLHVPRAFTQEISSHLYDLANSDGSRRFDGIAYRSRLGDDLENWAIWEPADSLTPAAGQPIDPDDPDLARALALFGLEFTA